MRELPLHKQVEQVKDLINTLIQTYEDTRFNTHDFHNLLMTLESPLLYTIRLAKVLKYLSDIGEIIIINETNVNYDGNYLNCGITEFEVTEKYGKLPGITINIPVATHIISNFESELSKMMQAYGLLASFENRMRFFIAHILEERKGSDWWDMCVSKRVRDNVESKKDHRLGGWHIELPKQDIQYAEFSDLLSIIIKNWEDVFKEIFKDQTHIKTYLESLETPRNTIAHSNVLSKDMMLELEINIKKILNLIEQVK